MANTIPLTFPIFDVLINVLKQILVPSVQPAVIFQSKISTSESAVEPRITKPHVNQLLEYNKATRLSMTFPTFETHSKILSRANNRVSEERDVENLTLLDDILEQSMTVDPSPIPVDIRPNNVLPTNRLPVLRLNGVWRYLPGSMLILTPAKFRKYRVRIGDKRIMLWCDKKKVN